MSFKCSSMFWMWSRGEKYSKISTDQCIHWVFVSIPSFGLNMSPPKMVLFSQQEINSYYRHLSFFQSSASNKNFHCSKIDRTISGLRLIPLKKVCGCTLLRMSCKKLFNPYSLCHTHISSLSLISFPLVGFIPMFTSQPKCRLKSPYMFTQIMSLNDPLSYI